MSEHCPHCQAEVSSVKYPSGTVQILNHGELECECNRLRADAERYRYIKEDIAKLQTDVFGRRYQMMLTGQVVEGGSLDEVIDKLIAENRSHSHPESP